MKGLNGRKTWAWLLAWGMSAALQAAPVNEIEPNDQSAQAQALGRVIGEVVVEGMLTTSSDVDYYEITGVSGAWALVAFLEGTNAKNMRLSAYGVDGTTLLDEDMGGWQNGSMIPGQLFQQTNQPMYVKVDGAQGNYRLRIVTVFVKDEREEEPNDAPTDSATVSSSTNIGILGGADTRDCYRFGADAGADIEVIVNGDPDSIDHDGDFSLTLYDATGTVQAQENNTGAAGNEYAAFTATSDGPFYACVDRIDGGAEDVRYRVLPLIDSDTYLPDYEMTMEWLNPGVNGTARVGEQLDFRIRFRNTSQVPIPPTVALSANISIPCLELVSTTPFTEVFNYLNSIRGVHSYSDAPLGVNEAYELEFSAFAAESCEASVQPSMVMDYYFYSAGGTVLTIPVIASACESGPYLLSGEVAGDGFLEYQSEQSFYVDDGSGQGNFSVRSPRRLRLVAPAFHVPGGSSLAVEQGATFAFSAEQVESCP